MAVPASSTTVGADEARTHFSELLARVEQGDEITITCHGAPVAHLVPIGQKATRAQRRAAIDAMRKLATRHHLGKVRIKDLIAEDRR